LGNGTTIRIVRFSCAAAPWIVSAAADRPIAASAAVLAKRNAWRRDIVIVVSWQMMWIRQRNAAPTKARRAIRPA
jgi:hypothetical protein